MGPSRTGISISVYSTGPVLLSGVGHEGCTMMGVRSLGRPICLHALAMRCRDRSRTDRSLVRGWVDGRPGDYALAVRRGAVPYSKSEPAALSSRRPPSLDRVPVSPVPRRHQYYEGATTSHPRIPGHLFGSLPGST